MTLICLGLSHQTAPLAVRGRVTYGPDALHNAWEYFFERAAPAKKGIEELVILSTCNRLELYARVDPAAAPDAPDTLVAPLIAFISQTRAIPAADFAAHLYHHFDAAAMAHLCRVASGLESMVLGEPQILGQVSEAYESARAAGAAGPLLEIAFRLAVKAGKRARTETAISRNAASISSVAVRLAQEVVGDVSRAQVLVIGAGEMGQQTVKALQKRGVTNIVITNRTYRHALDLAQQLGGVARPFEQLPAALAAADIVISSTGAPNTVIDAPAVRRAMDGRTGRGLVMVDIAVPNDVTPEVADIPGVHLFDIDDLRSQWEDGLADRYREIPLVEAIVAEAVVEYEAGLHKLAVAPVIKDLRQKAEAIRQQELARTMRNLPELDPETTARIHHLSRSLVNKLLHEPTLRLRDEAGNERSSEYASTVRSLFGLSGGEEDG